MLWDILIGIWEFIPKLIKGIKSKRKNRLNELEKDILYNAASSGGEIRIWQSDQYGDYVCAGKEKYKDSNRRKALDALEKLIELGLIVNERGIIYRLTKEGFKKAGKRNTGRM